MNDVEQNLGFQFSAGETLDCDSNEMGSQTTF